MRVLGAHVPFSVWTLVVFALGTALSMLVWRPLVCRCRWRPGPTLAALLLFTASIALTLTPAAGRPAMGLDACIPADWNDFLFNVLHTGGGIVADLLNVFLLFPLTISLVLASARMRPALAVALFLPPTFELIQTQLPGRSCAITDVLTNSAGALLGMMVGWVIQRLAVTIASNR